MIAANLEVCVDSVESLRSAIIGGADRIELCANLAVGGLTPTLDMLKAARSFDLPIRVMIRPRAGNFHFTEHELSQMKTEIEELHSFGFEGVVLGAATLDNRLDVESLRQLLETAKPMRATLHRVIDTLADPLAAIDEAVELGFDTVLTSGTQDSAAQGCEMIAEMITRAAGRIDIMPGAGISPTNAADILQKTRARWLHGSFSAPAHPSGDTHQNSITSKRQCQKMSAICREKSFESS